MKSIEIICFEVWIIPLADTKYAVSAKARPNALVVLSLGAIRRPPGGTYGPTSRATTSAPGPKSGQKLRTDREESGLPGGPSGGGVRARRERYTLIVPESDEVSVLYVAESNTIVKFNGDVHV